MNDLYALSFDFWRLFATEEVEVGASTLLANSKVPLLLSNAAWFPKVDDFQRIASWYVERDTVPALIVPALRDEAFNEALAGSAFVLERSFTFRHLEAPEDSADLISEQVSWAQGRSLGEHLAAHYGLPAYGVALGTAITGAMQRCPKIVCFAAYGVSGEVAGALVAFEHGDSLGAMMHSGEMESRLYEEAASRELGAVVLEPLPEGVSVKGEMSLERWSVR